MRGVLVALAMTGCAVAGNSSRSDAPAGGDAFVPPPPPADAPPLPIDSPQSACASNATCAGATALGTVSGDTGNATLTASGYQAAWYSVRVTENDSSPFATPMNLTVQLTSPQGTNYDLFLYINTASDVVECTTPAASSTSTGTSDQAHLTWGETGTFANGSDDSRTVSIEVRPVSGPCVPSAPYQLVVTGDL